MHRVYIVAGKVQCWRICCVVPDAYVIPGSGERAGRRIDDGTIDIFRLAAGQKRLRNYPNVHLVAAEQS